MVLLIPQFWLYRKNNCFQDAVCGQLIRIRKNINKQVIRKIIIKNWRQSLSSFCIHFPYFYCPYTFVVLPINTPWPQRTLSLEGVILRNTNLPFESMSPQWHLQNPDETGQAQIFTLNGFHQIISKPTHVQRDSSSCIDLIFSDKPSLIINKGVHASLHSSCHHQVIHWTFSLNMEYPPPC